MTDEKTRRRVLQAGGVSIAGLLAGCSDDSSGNGDLSDGQETTDDDPGLVEPEATTDKPVRQETTIITTDRPVRQETTIVTTDQQTPPQQGTTITTDQQTPPQQETTITTDQQLTTIPWREGGCDMGLVEPSDSSGQFTLMHGRQEGGTRFIQGTQVLFNHHDSYPTMNLERGPSRGYLNHLRESIPAGEGPHVFMYTHDIAGEFAQNGFLSDQRGNLRLDECAFTDIAWDASTYDGQMVGLPFAGQCPALIYNREILDDMGVEPPTTFEEWLSIMQEFHDPQNGAYGLSHPINAYFVSWAAQAFGEEIYDGDADELGITSDAVIRGLNLILEDLKPYMPGDPSEQAQMSVFHDGNSPFLVNGPWTITGLEEAGLDVGVMPIPVPDGGVARPYSGVELVFFARKMNDHGADARAAREFAEWYCTHTERLLNLVRNVNDIPVKTGLAREQMSETARGFAAQLETSYPIPQNPKMNSVWVPFETRMLEAFNFGDDPGPLMEEAAAEIRNGWA